MQIQHIRILILLTFLPAFVACGHNLFVEFEEIINNRLFFIKFLVVFIQDLLYKAPNIGMVGER